MVRPAVNTSGILSNKEVSDRMNRSLEQNFCYISLVPLTEETRTTIIGELGRGVSGPLLAVHNKYAEQVLSVMNK